MISAIFAIAASMGVASATLGVDVSQATLPDAWKCLKGDGYDFGIVRCFRSSGTVDPNCPHTIYNAHDGGIDHVDAYFFPCPKCSSSAKEQVDEMLDELAKFNLHHSDAGGKGTFGTIWLDIEGPQYWHASRDENIAYIKDAIAAVQARGVPVAVYTSESQWDPITGNADIASHLPLWYAHYDNSRSFGDFRPFAGWSKPSIKQYAGDATVCGAGVDLNWYP